MKTNKINRQLVSPKPKYKAKQIEKSQSSDSYQSRQNNSPFLKKISSPNELYESNDKQNKALASKASFHADKNTVRIGSNMGGSHQAKNRKIQNLNKTSKGDKQKTIKSKNKHDPALLQKNFSKQRNQIKDKNKLSKELEKKCNDKEKNKKKQKKAKKISNGQGNKKSPNYFQGEEQMKNEMNKVFNSIGTSEVRKLQIDLKKKNSEYHSSNKTTLRMGENNSTKQLKIRELPSYRQYCVIKGIFVPLQSTTERKCLDNMFVDTASTSPQINHSGFNKKFKHFHNSSNFEAQAKASEKEENKMNQNTFAEIGIETIKTQLAHYEVLVKAAQQDIGIQYSDRFSLNSGRKSIQSLKIETTKVKIQPSSQSSNIEKSSNMGLLQVMMKIESLELDQASALQQLGSQQKRHFRQVFESLIVKMRSPRVEAPLNCPREQESLRQISKLKYETKENDCCLQDKRQELEQLLMMRQSKQINQFNISIRSPQQVDTSVLAIIAGFTDIFCYAQINYEESFLQTMNSLYGLSYTDKYRCISKYCGQNHNEVYSNQVVISNRIKMEILKREALVKALPDRLFVNFMKELTESQNQQCGKDHNKNKNKENAHFKILNKNLNDQSSMESKSYLWIHSKAIFDCINQMLTPYRPFYPTKGDPFPWTLSPLKCLTFYSIDSDSLETVIEQLQQKITKFAKSLCGIHIDHNHYIAQDYLLKQQTRNWTKDIVFCIRREKLTKCIIEEEEVGEDPYLELEIQTTSVMHELSLLISDQIMVELAQQMVFLRNRSKKAAFL